MKHNKRARQEGALQRLQAAKVENSKRWVRMKEWEAKHGEIHEGDEWIQHDCNWQHRRDAEIAILKKKLNIS